MKKFFVFLLPFLLVPLLSGDRNENDSKIRAFLGQGKVKEAILFVDDCLKTGEDKAFYLRWKIELLKIDGQWKDALPCALELDEAGGATDSDSAYQVAALYLRTNEMPETLRWMARAAERGLKDLRLFGEEAWNGAKSMPEYAAILERIRANQGLGKPVPEFAAPLIGCGEIALSGLRGKVVLIDFWATWCAPCVATLPSLKELHRKYNSRGFEIIGLSLDREKKALQSFLAKDPLPWPIVFTGKDWSDATVKLYGVQMIPVTFLVDREGRLRFYNLRESEFELAVQSLLAEPSK